MKNFKRYICLALTTLLVFTLFTGCKKEEDKGKDTGDKTKTEEKYENGLPKDQKVVLKCGFFETGELKKHMEYAMESFTKAYPNVTFDPLFSPSIGDITQPKIAANDDKDMFDIFSCMGALEVELVKNNKIEPVEDLWDQCPQDTPGKPLKELAQPGVYENAKRTEGKTYQLPWGTFVGGMFFDESLFDKNGWNKTPKTWDEFVKLCDDIKKTGINPIVYPGVYAGYLTAYAFNPKMFELADINGDLKGFTERFQTGAKPYYNSPESLEVYKRMAELGKKGYFAPGIAALNHTQAQMMVLQGRAAMVPCGDWIETEMKDATPEGFKWGYMAVPVRDKEDQNLYYQGGQTDSVFIWANKPDLNKAWAKQFLLWLWTQDVQKVDAEIGVLSIRKDFNAVDSYSDSKRKISQYVKDMDAKMVDDGYYKSWPKDPAAKQADKLWSENLVNMTLGKKDYVEVLNKCEEYMDKARAAEK